MFTQFDRTGHRMLSAEITQELQTLAQRHGLDIHASGGKYGDTELVISVKVTTGDKTAAEARKRTEIDRDGRWVGGLQGSDYGAIFTSQRDQYRFVGVNPGRPKFPISGERVRDGKGFKFPQTFAAQIIAQRATAPATPPIASAGPPVSPPMQTPQLQVSGDGSLDAFSQF